jgi:hypothetical protein
MSQRSEFDRVWPMLEPAVQRFGSTHAKEHIWALLDGDRVHLYTSPNSAIVFEIQHYPTGIRRGHVWLAGGELPEIAAAIPPLETWGHWRGCHEVTMDAREGWQRAKVDGKLLLDGYRVRGVRLVKVLNGSEK